MRHFKRIVVTGGLGFIGTDFIRMLADNPSFTGKILNIDNMTYSANENNLSGIDKYIDYNYERLDISDFNAIALTLSRFDPDLIVHFAAESHVDFSIKHPDIVTKTNVMGTEVMLDVARRLWKDRKDVLFHHVSTDEVYGALGEKGAFTEISPYNPHSPYSAGKAASDLIAKAFITTYGMPITISNCSNNYGPFQSPDKFMPKVMLNLLTNKKIPVFGDGKNVRDWLYVRDHNRAIWSIIQEGIVGEKYNIGGKTEKTNLEIIETIVGLYCKHINSANSDPLQYIDFVEDRKGHDRRYAVDYSKIQTNLNWTPTTEFNSGLEATFNWYANNIEWCQSFVDR